MVSVQNSEISNVCTDQIFHLHESRNRVKVAPTCFTFSWATKLYKKLSCTSWWISASCCKVVLQQLLTSQFLYSQQKFCFHGNYTEAQIHPIFTIRLHFTQKVIGELPFLLHQNCLHIKKHFLRKSKKILSRGFSATLNLQNIKVAPKPLDRNFLNFLKKCSLMCKQVWCNKKEVHRLVFV